MGEQSQYKHDVFVCYSQYDQAWVWGALLPRLKEAGLQVMIDSDFEIGVPIQVNIERAVDGSRYTIVVLTRAWLESEWTEFESLLVSNGDVAARKQKLLPLMLSPCQPPTRIAMLTYADFTNPLNYERQFQRLLQRLRGN